MYNIFEEVSSLNEYIDFIHNYQKKQKPNCGTEDKETVGGN